MAIELRPSRRLIAFLVAAHLVAIIAAVTGLPAVPAAMLSAALILSLFGQLQSVRLTRSGSIKALQIATDGLIQFRDQKGDWQHASLQGHVYVSAWLVILPLADPSGRRHTAVLLADSAGEEDLRRLRVWLQWGQKGGNEGRSRANS